MRAFGVIALILLAACTEPTAQTPSPSSTPSLTPTAQAACRLPVWWPANSTATAVDIHAGFVSIPDGAITDVGVLPQPPVSLLGLPSVQTYGATYESASNRWVHFDRAYVSPEGTSFAYWTSTGSNDNSVHVVDLATGVDRVIYRGATLFIIIAFEAKGIYLVHGVALRQGAFEKLYLLDPEGGTPTLVPGSDRHMYQYGWVLISDGAAWGIDNRVDGTAYIYSVVRLDLATAQATQWIEGPDDDMFWPLGTDSTHRLYAGDYHANLRRVAAPGQVEVLANPGQVGTGDGIGSSSSFVSDSVGEWFAGNGGVWLYSDTGQPRLFGVGPQNAQVFPAGPCG
jgi:hypothetical protein